MNRSARAGLALLLSLAVIAIAAPIVAGEQPILVLSGGRFDMPALRAALRLIPEAGPAARAALPEDDAFVLRPPIRHGPLSIDLERRLTPPGRGHWLGTDELGRDILSRILHGTRPSLLVALIATVISLLLGIPIGAAAGYGGRRVDLLLARLIEASLSFPSLILLLLLSALALSGGGGRGIGPDTGLRSLLVVGCAVGIARWGIIARYMRGEVLRLAGTDLALSARAAGAAPLRILARHLVPAGIGPVAVSAAFGAGAAVVAEASLSFLGMGVQPPSPTWGQMIASAVDHSRSWWMMLFPGIMVALTVAAFNLLGEGLGRRAL